MTTVVSRPFRFTEFQLIDAPSKDEATWKPVKLRNDVQPRAFTGKFVYAFQKLGSNVELYAEFFAGDDGALSVASGRDAHALERDKRAKPSPLGGAHATLPHTINGKRAFYFFVVSRIRLPTQSITDLEAEMPAGVGPPLDLERDETFLQVAGTDGSSTTVENFVPLLDPFTIAINLHSRYEDACNALISFTMEYGEQLPEQRQRVRDRHKQLMLARLLKAVVESDPGDKLGLRNEFENDDPTAPARFVTAYEQTVDQLIRKRDRAVEPLLHFLNGSLLIAMERSFLVFEVEDYSRWIQFVAIVMERINESPLGKARIGKLIDAPNVVFRDYVLRTTPAPDAQFAVGRKAHSAIVALWKEALPGVLTKTPGAASRLANALKLIARIDLVRVETKTNTYTYRKKNGRLRTVSKPVQVVTAIDPAVALGTWAQDGVPGKALERLAQGIEVLNVMLSFAALASAEPDETGFALLNLLGSVLDGVAAFNVVLKLAERSIKVVGAISAAIDTILAVRDGANAYGRDDTSSAVGFGIAATGSVLILTGCVCAASGLAAGATVVGLPLAAFLEIVGAVLVAAGWVIAVFSADTEIELFTNHCIFGKSSFSTSNDQPKWASAPFRDWSKADGLGHQIKSLLTILAAFTVQATDFTAIDIRLGLVMSDSKVLLKFRCLFNLGIVHDPELLIDLGQRTMVQLKGSPQDLTQFSVNEVNGRPVVSVTAEFAPGKRPERAIQHQSCDVDVQLLVDQTGATVPGNGPLRYRVHQLNSLLSGPKLSHD